MRDLSNKLIDWVKEKEQELVDEVVKLISEDAPKNKFSIVTGKKKMLEEFESVIEKLDVSE